jgi:serine/threonine protein kinase
MHPQNIGFDVRGDIKVFDFGLAKELKQVDCEGKDQYISSGMAGTRRYMAPEMAQAMGYGKCNALLVIRKIFAAASFNEKSDAFAITGLSADVYSFGVLFWEMLSLRDAYDKYSRDKHYKEVIVEGKRPKISKSWPSVICNLIERCWHRQPSDRPSFTAVCELIKFGIPNEFTASDRSDDLKMRSYKSKQGNLGESYHTDHTDESNEHVQFDTPLLSCSDSLSRSIRIKKWRYEDCKVVPTKAVEYERE